MAKLVALACFVSLAFICQGFPTRESEIAAAAGAGNWDEVQKILQKYYNPTMFGLTSVPDGINVKNLKPAKGSRVYGESEFTFHQSTSDDKGKIHEKSGGHKVINDNGQVSEYDLKPPAPYQTN